MRNVILIIWLSIFSSNLFADSVICEKVTLATGQTVSLDYPFMIADAPIFRLSDGKSTQWKFSLWKNSSYNWRENRPVLSPILESVGEKTFFQIPISADLFGDNLCEYQFKGDSTIYYKGVVYALKDDVVADSSVIYFNLLPATPVVSDAYMTYTYDWKHDDLQLSGILHYTLSSNQADNLFMSLINGDSYLFTEPEDSSIGTYYSEGSGFNREIISSGVYNVAVYHCEWGQYFKIYACNEFGITKWPLVLCTTDYITDSKVLQRLEELKNEYTNIETPTMNASACKVMFTHNKLMLGKGLEITHVLLFDLLGRNISIQNSWNEVDLSFLPNGFYFVKLMLDDGSIITKKILKK